MLVHLDGLGGHEGLGASVLGTERHDDVLVTGNDNLEVIIGLESAGDSLENDLGLLVSAHGIDYDTDHGGSLLTNISNTGRTARAGC